MKQKRAEPMVRRTSSDCEKISRLLDRLDRRTAACESENAAELRPCPMTRVHKAIKQLAADARKIHSIASLRHHVVAAAVGTRVHRSVLDVRKAASPPADRPARARQAQPYREPHAAQQL
jgi:hypothetical protein